MIRNRSPAQDTCAALCQRLHVDCAVTPVVIRACISACIIITSFSHSLRAQEKPASAAARELEFPKTESFLALLERTESLREQGLADIEANWQISNVPMLLETYRVTRAPGARLEIRELLRKKMSPDFDGDIGSVFQAIWNQDYEVHPQYADFKSNLYARIDPRFAEYFDSTSATTIRLDEVRWGGVRRDGIPPLKNPHTLSVDEAGYLADSDVVFGVMIEGEARAYPKRILGWHEMVKDVVGGVSINGVYCTLCGSMIVYRTHDQGGQHHELGTSGFLYRSNKLMYDHKTKSLWSTLLGKPVIGKLVGQGIRLEALPVVTTTWGKWKSRHPSSRVLSLRTGYRKDYAEGAAYRKYFATEQLMFETPALDSRLANKDEVFVLRSPPSLDKHQPEGSANDKSRALAIATDYLAENPVFHTEIERTEGSLSVVVLTDTSGANRAYDCGEHRFARLAGDTILDSQGSRWKVAENRLSFGSEHCERLPAHRTFWFAWFAAHPETRLVK